MKKTKVIKLSAIEVCGLFQKKIGSDRNVNPDEIKFTDDLIEDLGFSEEDFKNLIRHVEESYKTDKLIGLEIKEKYSLLELSRDVVTLIKQ